MNAPLFLAIPPQTNAPNSYPVDALLLAVQNMRYQVTSFTDRTGARPSKHRNYIGNQKVLGYAQEVALLGSERLHLRTDKIAK